MLSSSARFYDIQIVIRLPAFQAGSPYRKLIGKMSGSPSARI